MAGKAGNRSRRAFGLLGAGALVLASVASCGSNTTLPATVYVTSTVGPGTDMTHPCNLATVTTELQIGSVTSGVPTNTAGTTVACTVQPSGSSYSVDIHVQANGGSFSVSGTMPAKGTGTGITASVDYGTVAPILYSGTNCSVTMANNLTGTTTPGYDPSTGPPVAPGRVWATVTCDNMSVMGQNGICQGMITFRMENCVGSPSS